MPDIAIPWAYSDVIRTPEGKLWKDVMDYELAKLEEMNTWSNINEGDVPPGEQVLPGMWVHIVKNLDSEKTNLALSDTFAPVSHISSPNPVSFGNDPRPAYLCMGR